MAALTDSRHTNYIDRADRAGRITESTACMAPRSRVSPQFFFQPLFDELPPSINQTSRLVLDVRFVVKLLPYRTGSRL